MSSTKVVAAGKCNTIGCSKWTFGCGLKCKLHAPPTNVFTLIKRVFQATPGKRTAGVRVLLISSNLPSTKVGPVPSTQAHLLIEFDLVMAVQWIAICSSRCNILVDLCSLRRTSCLIFIYFSQCDTILMIATDASCCCEERCWCYSL